MKNGKGRWRVKRLALIATAGMTCGLNSCDLGEFTTTSTVTLDGREVVEYLINSAILTPINTYVHDRVDEIFDQLEDEDE